MNTLVNKTIEDTLLTIKQYENARWVLTSSMWSVCSDLCLVNGFGCKQKKRTVQYGKIEGVLWKKGDWCLRGQRAGCVRLVVQS